MIGGIGMTASAEVERKSTARPTQRHRGGGLDATSYRCGDWKRGGSQTCGSSNRAGWSNRGRARRRGGSRKRGGSRPRGAAVLEAIIALPILLIAVFGAFLFTTILMVRSGVKQAAIEGAREASKVFDANYDVVNAATCPPANPPAADAVVTAAVSAVDKVLGTYGLQTGDNVQVIVNDNADATYRGEQIVNPCAAPALTDCAGKVEVRVIVRYSAIPIPDLLNVFGFSVTGENFDFAAMGRRYGIPCP